MKIKRETLPPGEDNDSTALPQTPLQTKTGAKKRHMGKTHYRTYQGSGKKSGFSQGSVPCHLLNRLTNRAKTPLTWTLLHPLPLASNFDRRARVRRRIWRRGAHPLRTAQGICQPELAANEGQCWPAIPRNAPVRRKDAIASTAGATGAPASRICA